MIAHSSGPPSPKVRVVVVDDDTTTRIAMTHVLELEGFAVSPAANGREALQVIAEADPAVVVSDVSMPLMGGEALLVELHANNGPPVVLMTGHAQIDAQAAALLGAAGLVHKPVDIDVMLAAIDTALARPRA